MKAKEMFEELGYELKTKGFNEWNKDNIIYTNKNENTIIELSKDTHHISIRSYNFYEPQWFTLDELKAINKQIEELGWND